MTSKIVEGRPDQPASSETATIPSLFVPIIKDLQQSRWKKSIDLVSCPIDFVTKKPQVVFPRNIYTSGGDLDQGKIMRKINNLITVLTFNEFNLNSLNEACSEEHPTSIEHHSHHDVHTHIFQTLLDNLALGVRITADNHGESCRSYFLTNNKPRKAGWVSIIETTQQIFSRK